MHTERMSLSWLAILVIAYSVITSSNVNAATSGGPPSSLPEATHAGRRIPALDNDTSGANGVRSLDDDNDNNSNNTVATEFDGSTLENPPRKRPGSPLGEDTDTIYGDRVSHGPRQDTNDTAVTETVTETVADTNETNTDQEEKEMVNEDKKLLKVVYKDKELWVLLSMVIAVVGALLLSAGNTLIGVRSRRNNQGNDFGKDRQPIGPPRELFRRSIFRKSIRSIEPLITSETETEKSSTRLSERLVPAAGLEIDVDYDDDDDDNDSDEDGSRTHLSLTL